LQMHRWSIPHRLSILTLRARVNASRKEFDPIKCQFLKQRSLHNVVKTSASSNRTVSQRDQLYFIVTTVLSESVQIYPGKVCKIRP